MCRKESWVINAVGQVDMEGSRGLCHCGGLHIKGQVLPPHETCPNSADMLTGHQELEASGTQGSLGRGSLSEFLPVQMLPLH